MVRKKVLASQKTKKELLTRTILGRQRKNIRRKTNMGQVDRGSAGTPVPRCSAEKAPQVVEKPGLTC